MRFSDSFLDDIRDRLRISEVIGQRVGFDRKKTNPAKGDYWACCPFHGEKTPSFHCEDRKGRYHCFGCGESGDHFRFLMSLDGLNFHEAVERLAAQAGLAMPVQSPQEHAREENRKSLYQVMALAGSFFCHQLHEPCGADARAWLRGRGLSGAVQKEFGIGFAPDRSNALKQYLIDHGVTPEQIEACGLVNHGEGIALSYDKFRGRVMFPIEDSRGRIIAFGGRALRDDALAKYLNSPQTELFSKSKVLFNFARARKAIHDSGDVIIVEGYMDVIALHAHGVTNAVAPLGTALTGDHLATLWKVCGRPTLCFDADDAGRRASMRVIDLALPNLDSEKTLRFAQLPDGLDPDDFVNRNGVEAFRKIFEAATPLHEILLQRRLDNVLLQTPEQKAKLEADVMRDVGKIKDPGVQKYYRSHQRMRLFELFGGMMNKKHKPAMAAQKTDEIAKALKRNAGGREVQLLLGLCVEYPGVIREFIEEIAGLAFENKVHGSFVTALYKLYVAYEALDVSSIYDRLGEGFMFVLKAIHGSKKTKTVKLSGNERMVEYNRPRGHVLYMNFPMLLSDPPVSTIRMLAKFLLDKIYHRIALGELDAAKKNTTMDPEIVIALAEDARTQQQHLNALERELDECFQALRGGIRILV